MHGLISLWEIQKPVKRLLHARQVQSQTHQGTISHIDPPVPPLQCHVIERQLSAPSFLVEKKGLDGVSNILTIQNGLPEGVASDSPVSECWWDPAYFLCQWAAENKEELGGVLLLQRTCSIVDRGQSSSVAFPSEEKRRVRNMCPRLWLFRTLTGDWLLFHWLWSADETWPTLDT